MDSTTTTTLWPIEAKSPRSRAGFTLVEVIIGAVMSSFILAGILSSFLFLARSGVNVQNYNDMEAQARQALEVFAEDVRQASAISWTDASTLTLTVDTTPVIYGYNSGLKAFYRTSGGATRNLVTGVTNFQFKGYTITGTPIADFSTAAALLAASRSTKQLQISLEAARTNQTVARATNTVLSARFILRNKIVTA